MNHQILQVSKILVRGGVLFRCKVALSTKRIFLILLFTRKLKVGKIGYDAYNILYIEII